MINNLKNLFILLQTALLILLFSFGSAYAGDYSFFFEDTDPYEKNYLPADDNYNIKPMSVYPLASSSIYTYSQLINDLTALAVKYPDLIVLGNIGKSVDGRTIYSVKMGKGSQKILIVGAAHAREWLTSPLLVEMISTYAAKYSGWDKVKGEPVKYFLDRYTLWFIPMVNPDGVTLCQFGADAFPSRRSSLLSMNHPNAGSNFTRWKANIRGVDLNRNYNVQWKKTLASSSVVTRPYFQNYPGSAPESEPETKAIANWIRNNNPVLIMDYHSAGEILFWYYYQTGKTLENHRKIVKAMSDYSGYTMEGVNPDKRPNTTLTRWGVMERKIPSVCVEIGKYTSSYLKMSDLPGIIGKNRYMVMISALQLPGYIPYVPVSSISLNNSNLTLATGEKVTVRATINPSNASYKNVTWSSSDSNVATVDSNGVITVKDIGLTTITATAFDGGKKAVCNIYVPYVPPESITLSENEMTLYTRGVKNRKTIRATVNPANTSYKGVIWSSDDESIVTVNKSGTVMVTENGFGDTRITVKTVDGDITEYCTVILIDDGIMYGDVNGDGLITVNDAILILRHIVGLAVIDEETLPVADITGNGEITVEDAILILRYIVGLY